MVTDAETISRETAQGGALDAALIEELRQTEARIFEDRLISNEREQLRSLKERLREAIKDLPDDVRADLEDQINRAASVSQMASLPQKINTARENAEIDDDRHVAVNLSINIAEQQRINALVYQKWDFNEAGRAREYANLLIGDNPEAASIYAEQLEDKNSQSRRNADYINSQPESVRLNVETTRAQARQQTPELMRTIRENHPAIVAAHGSHFSKLERMAGRGNVRVYQALDAFNETGDWDVLQSATARDVALQEEARREARRVRPNASEAAINVAADQAATNASLAQMIREGQRVVLRQGLQGNAQPARELLRVTSGSDEDRADAIVAYRAEKGLSPISREQALAYTRITDPKPAVDKNAVILQSMNLGMDAMARGDNAGALRIANNTADLMRAAGYPDAQVRVARTILTENANIATNLPLGVGQRELVQVMSDPTRRADIIRVTMEDIRTSTPDNISRDGAFLAARYLRNQLVEKLSIFRTSLNSSALQSDLDTAIRSDSLNLSALGIADSLNDAQKLIQLRNVVAAAGIRFVDFDANNNNSLSAAEINRAIQATVVRKDFRAEINERLLECAAGGIAIIGNTNGDRSVSVTEAANALIARGVTRASQIDTAAEFQALMRPASARGRQ